MECEVCVPTPLPPATGLFMSVGMEAFGFCGLTCLYVSFSGRDMGVWLQRPVASHLANCPILRAVLPSAKEVTGSPLVSYLEKVLSELAKQFPKSAENLDGNLGAGEVA